MRCQSSTSDKTSPFNFDCNDEQASYKLIQLEGSGLYILAKDIDPTGHLDNQDEGDLHDLHMVREKNLTMQPIKVQPT